MRSNTTPTCKITVIIQETEDLIEKRLTILVLINVTFHQHENSILYLLFLMPKFDDGWAVFFFIFCVQLPQEVLTSLWKRSMTSHTELLWVPEAFLELFPVLLARLPTFSISVTEIYQLAPSPPPPPNSMLFIVMNSSLLVSNIVRGEGVHNSSDVISSCFQISLSTQFRAIWSRRAKDFCRGLQFSGCLFFRSPGAREKRDRKNRDLENEVDDIGLGLPAWYEAERVSGRVRFLKKKRGAWRNKIPR